MNKSSLPWFRFYTETVNDTKFDVAARRLGYLKIELLGIWAIFLALASKSPVRGMLMVTNSIPYNLDDLSVLCGIDREKLERIVNCFCELEMTECDSDDRLIIKNWNKRQFESDNSTERTREYRKKTPSHGRHNAVTVTPPDTDTESDTETEKEEVVAANPPKSNIFSLYENNIGLMSPMIAEKLKLFEDEFPPGWIQRAFEIAVENNARNLNYIRAILDRWRANRYDGDRKNGKGPPQDTKNVIDELVEEMIDGENP